MSLGDMVNDCYGAIKRWQEATTVKQDTQTAKTAKTAEMDFIEKSLQEINGLLEKLDLEEKTQDAQALQKLLLDLNKKDAAQEKGFDKLLIELQTIAERELPKSQLAATVSVIVPEFKRPFMLTKKRERTETMIDLDQTVSPTHRRPQLPRSSVTIVGNVYYKDGVLMQGSYGSQRCAVVDSTILDNSEQRDDKSGTQTMSPTLSL